MMYNLYEMLIFRRGGIKPVAFAPALAGRFGLLDSGNIKRLLRPKTGLRYIHPFQCNKLRHDGSWRSLFYKPIARIL